MPKKWKESVARLDAWEVMEETMRRNCPQVARRLGMNERSVRRWQEPYRDYSQSGARAPLESLVEVMDTVIEIDNEKGLGTERGYLPLRWLAHHYNFALVPLPVSAAGESELQEKLLASVKEFGELASEASSALADGKLTRDEARGILREGYELMDSAAAFLALVEEKA
jgi:Phage regulatory protein CII (CP76)